jgi:hypothetical protein
MKFNVVLFVDSSMLGGIETHLVELSKLLTNNHISSYIMFYQDHKNQAFYDLLNQENIRYEFLKGNLSSLLKQLKSFDSNTVIHTHGYKAGILGRLVCKITKHRCISTYHAGEAGTGKLKLYNTLDKLLSPLSINFAVSKQIKHSIKNAQLLENFIAINKPQSHTNKFKTVINIGFVGRLSFEKGPDIFCRLAGNMQQDLNVKFHIFGDGPLKGELPNLHNLEYHGLVERNTIWKKIDVLLICSREEGLPMALLEAISEKKFIISSAVGAIPSIIKHGITGFLIQETNAQHFEQQVEKLLAQSEDHTNTIINNAYSTLEERFSGKQQFKLLKQAYTGT